MPASGYIAAHRPLDPDVVTEQFARARQRVRVKRIRLHDVRHCHATLLLEAGVRPRVVQERLGHSSVMVTYSHVAPHMQAEVATKIGGLVDGLRRQKSRHSVTIGSPGHSKGRLARAPF
ncbi:MAG TPA: tyrosine-type recombinase/integrase [Candidatus Dormibacteraeota bacterium]